MISVGPVYKLNCARSLNSKIVEYEDHNIITFLPKNTIAFILEIKHPLNIKGREYAHIFIMTAYGIGWIFCQDLEDNSCFNDI